MSCWYNSSTSWNGEGAPGPLYVLNEKESRINEYQMTKLLSGYPGEFVVMARRKGESWYIGGLNGEDSPQTLSFCIKELVNSINQITIIKDGSEERSFAIESIKEISDNDRIFEINCLPRGGLVAVIE